MFLITGASAAGKTTVGNELLGQITDPVVLDADILWTEEMDTPEDGYARFRSLWLRLAINIHQSGRSTLLIGSGIPEQYEARPERAYVGPIHWMALVCDDDSLETRLRERPAWRGATDHFLTAMRAFNAHLRARQDIRVVDTTHESIAETVGQVRAWLLHP
jgi:gluconate kinase